MFDNRKRELTIKILVGQDQGQEAQKQLQEEDSAPTLLEVDKPELAQKEKDSQEQDPQEGSEVNDPEMESEMMGGAESDMQRKLDQGLKPRGLNDTVRMAIMKKKLIKE